MVCMPRLSVLLCFNTFRHSSMLFFRHFADSTLCYCWLYSAIMALPVLEQLDKEGLRDVSRGNGVQCKPDQLRR